MVEESFTSELSEAVIGIGIEVIMACMDASIISVASDGDGFIDMTWSSSAPEQVEAIIYDAILKSKHIKNHEGNTLSAE